MKVCFGHNVEFIIQSASKNTIPDEILVKESWYHLENAKIFTQIFLGPKWKGSGETVHFSTSKLF